MKFPPFEYHAPATTAEAIGLLTADPEAKLLAGGQSLLPLMAMRLAYPTALVDLGNVAGLASIDSDGGDTIRVGAMTTLRTVERSDVIASRLPLVHQAVKHVAHEPIRNRGTFGGNLAHADPASELPAVMLALDAELVVEGPGGERVVPAREFWKGPFTTAVGVDELLTRVDIPAHEASWAFQEVARRAGDFALALVAVGLESDGGTCSGARIALSGVGGAPIRARDAEEAIVGQAIDEASAKSAAEAATRELEPTGDVHCSGDGRRKIARTLVERAVLAAGNAA